MPLHVLGINHHTAPLEIREKIAFPAERLPETLAELRSRAGVGEAVIVSTCNRTEIYCEVANPEAVKGWLARSAGDAGASVESLLYLHANDDAVRHAFRVASGLDSMV